MNAQPKSKTVWNRIDAMSDNDIDCSDIPELSDDWFKNAQIRKPSRMTTISINEEFDLDNLGDSLIESFKEIIAYKQGKIDLPDTDEYLNKIKEMQKTIEDKRFLDDITEVTEDFKRSYLMPEITRFYGIIIKIFFAKEHNPPHFHAIYGEYNGLFKIDSLEMIEGDLPAKAQSLVKEWAAVYSNDIMDMWNTKTLKKLPPLE